jgi:hypothetical protein
MPIDMNNLRPCLHQAYSEVLTWVQRRLSDDEDMVVMDMDDYSIVVGSSVSSAQTTLNTCCSSSTLLLQDVSRRPPLHVSPSNVYPCVTVPLTAVQGFENNNGTPPKFEPFAASQDPWKAFPDPPAAADAPQDAGWADFGCVPGTASGALPSCAHGRSCWVTRNGYVPSKTPPNWRIPMGVSA